MITLDATTKTLEIDLTGAVATNQLPFVASYVDISQSTFAMTGIGEQDGASNNTTAVTCLSAPGASTSRVLKFFSWKNSDTASVEGWIQLNNNGTLREIWKGTLQVGDTLEFVDADNFKVIDANGNVKTTVGTVPSSIVLGTTTNDNAAAGRLGEYVESTVLAASAVGLTTGTTANVTSISLTAGDWDVGGFVGFTGNTATSVTIFNGGSSSVSATLPTSVDIFVDGFAAGTTIFATINPRIVIPEQRFSLSATTTIYLVATSTFTVNTCSAFGNIWARRVR